MPSRVALLALVVAGCSFKPGSLNRRDAGDTVDDVHIDAATELDDVLLDTPAPTSDAASDAAVDALVARTCPPTYMLTNVDEPGSKYRLVTASDDWAAAEADCEDDGGTLTLQPAHLVVLDDSTERSWVYQQGTTDKWIGASDRLTEGALQAVTDQAAPHFGNAASQEVQKDCMFTTSSETVMELCTAGFQYICECDGLAADPTNF